MKPNQSENVRVLNDSLHSKRTQNAIRELFTTHDLKNAILYQFIVTGSDDREEYQATMKALMRHIRTKCRAEYIGAFEVGEEKNGLHIHAFVLVETVKHFPSDLLSVADGGFIARRIKRKNKGKAPTDKHYFIRIEPPKNAMHEGQMFARLDTPAKLENCINWCEYIIKSRSKADVPGRETYFGSEFVSNIAKREAQRQKRRDALWKTSAPARAVPAPAVDPCSATVGQQPAQAGAVETIQQPAQDANNANTFPTGSPSQEPEDDNDTGDTSMDAAARYIASKYETAVDAGMDVSAIQRFLKANGINRTIAAVVHDLDHTYGFHEYAQRHPAPVTPSQAELDALVDSVPTSRVSFLKSGLVIPKGGVYNRLTDVRQSYTSEPTL